jgi:hypothetical protein
MKKGEGRRENRNVIEGVWNYHNETLMYTNSNDNNKYIFKNCS